MIEVNASAVPDQFGTAVRYLIMGASAFATGLGFQAASDHISNLLVYAGPLGTGFAFLWGQYSSHKNARLKAVLADSAPIARLK